MGRVSTFDDRDVYAAVGARLAAAGKATFADIVADAGVSVGSLYHRFGSREGLLAETFLDALAAFQDAFLSALAPGDFAAAEAAARAVPRFCRNERQRAVVLACCRASEFVSADTPPALARDIARRNRRAAAAIAAFARRNRVRLDTARLALIGVPLGAVRLYLPRRPPPPAVETAVAAACRAVLASRA